MGIDFTRGDKATLAVTDLRDGDGNPTTISAGDVLRFTVKKDTKSGDNKALIKKDSVSGGIVFVPDTGTATITIVGTDWSSVSAPINTPIVWDLQIALGDSADEIFTLDSGNGRIIADVTITAP